MISWPASRLVLHSCLTLKLHRIGARVWSALVKAEPTLVEETMSAAVVFMAVTFMSRVGAAFRPRISSSVGQRSAAGEGVAVIALALPAASAAPLPLAFAFAGPVGGVVAFAFPFAPGVAVGVGLALCFAALGSRSLGPRWLSEVIASSEIAAGCCALGAPPRLSLVTPVASAGTSAGT